MINDDPLQPHSHDPNPEPPSDDPTFRLTAADGSDRSMTVAQLRALPKTTVENCYIVSTGHGTSGPFTFQGAALLDVVAKLVPADRSWTHLEVVSADGFGTRLTRQEIENDQHTRPMVLAYVINGEPMTRQQGLVRLIVPSEQEDALRQVKWVESVRIQLP